MSTNPIMAKMSFPWTNKNIICASSGSDNLHKICCSSRTSVLYMYSKITNLHSTRNLELPCIVVCNCAWILTVTRQKVQLYATEGVHYN